MSSYVRVKVQRKLIRWKEYSQCFILTENNIYAYMLYMYVKRRGLADADVTFDNFINRLTVRLFHDQPCARNTMCRWFRFPSFREM